MGGDPAGGYICKIIGALKSTPPAWAGTAKIHKNWQCNPSAIRRND